MSCPSENQFVELQAGLLQPDAARALHRHMDDCSRCLQLAAMLGSLPSETQPTTPLVGPAPKITSVPALVTMLLAHLGWSVVILLAVWSRGWYLRPEAPWALRCTVSYWNWWAAIGPTFCVLAIWLVRNERPWARAAVVVYSSLSILTIALMPLGIYTWWTHAGRRELRNPRAEPRRPPGKRPLQ